MKTSEKNHIVVNTSKPNLRRRLFWDWRYEDIDWQDLYLNVISRVVERGKKEDWEEIIRFYGRDKVIRALKYEIKYLPDFAVKKVTSYFNLKPEELACYERKQLRKGHWI